MTVKHVLGQWGHSYPDEAGRGDWTGLLLRWLDRWLLEEDVDTGPPAEVQDSEGRWRAEEAWPPSGSPLRLSLEPGGRLATDPGTASGPLTLGPDPVRLRLGDSGLELPAAGHPARAGGGGVGLPLRGRRGRR